MTTWGVFGAALVGMSATLFGVAAAFDPYATTGRHIGHAIGYGAIVGIVFGAGLGFANGVAAALTFVVPYALGAAETSFFRRRASR